MMLYPSIMDLMKKAESRYSLVIAASKRAREISETEEDGATLEGAKSITRAVSEIDRGDIEIIEYHDVEPDKRAILENNKSQLEAADSQEKEDNE